ncbi:MAG: CHAT domain-containing tetratricopeptide repeat protein [Chitinophagaceae bacterium]
MKPIMAYCLLFFSFATSAQSLEDLVLDAGQLYLDGKYEQAVPAAQKAVVLLKQQLGEENIFYIGLQTILASSYEHLFQYQQSEIIYLDVKERIRRVSGEEHESYTACLNNLAGLYEHMGQYEKSEPLFIKAIAIRKKIAGENDPAYCTSMNGLAALYHSMGQYSKSEPLYIQVKDIRKKLLGENNIDYATSLNNLATLYAEMGQYEKAEPLYTTSLEIRKKLLGENNSDYATSLNNLASLWQSMEKYTKAEASYIKAMEIRKKTLGTDHVDYATSLNNLASLYVTTGQYKKAEPLLIEATDTWKRAVGANSPEYAMGLNNLATFYRKTQTQPQKAETLYLESIRLRKAMLGETHPYYLDTQNGLALLYAQLGQYAKAEPLFFSSSHTLLQNITNTFPILSEKEKGNYLEYNREIIDCNNSFLYNYPRASASVVENNYNLELGFKSLSLADTRNMLESVRNSSDTVVKGIFARWMTAKNILSKQYALPAATRMKDLKALEADAERLEKELNRRSSAFGNQQKGFRVTVQDVRKNLGPDEAAIEFVKFRLYNVTWTDSVIYGAYILRKEDAVPRFVPLCEKKQLDRLFDSAGNTATKLVKNFYRGLDIKSREARLGTKLYQLIWEPLEPFLKGIKKIAYSPAGKFYGIAFHALPVDSSTILMDKYQLQQYTSTRQLSLRTETNNSSGPGGIVLFGDALFTMDSLELVRQRKSGINKDGDVVSGSLAKNRGNENGVWVDLPGTAEEIKKISQLFEQNKISNKSFIQAAASEDNLKAFASKAPPVMHIATHGFFLPDPEKKNQKRNGIGQGNAYSLADDPLLRSGIVLAGGNYAWSGKAPVEGVEDGIVTAYEISQLNLSNTELVVLSACETALGDVKGSEGVFGLQRGFKMSGVKKMIVSLWQVPDKETAELMTGFYTYWLSGKSLNASFYQAQSDMRKKYPAYYWAAFVLVE